VVSATELRDALTAQLERWIRKANIRRCGKWCSLATAKGGLLCKLTVTDTGDQLWRGVFSDKPPEEFEPDHETSSP